MEIDYFPKFDSYVVGMNIDNNSHGNDVIDQIIQKNIVNCDKQSNSSEPIYGEASEQSKQTVVVDKSKGLTFFQGLATSLNFNFGLSVFIFPFQLIRCGLSGFIVLVTVCLIAWTTVRMSGKIMDKFPHIRTYADIGKQAATILFSHSESKSIAFATGLIRGFQGLELFFYLVYILILIQQAFHFIFPTFNTSFSMFAAVALILPTVVLIDPVPLSFVSTIGNISMIAISVIVVGNCFHVLILDKIYYTEWNFVQKDVYDWFNGYSSIVLLFASHALLPTVYTSLENKEDFKAVVNFTHLCLLVGLLCIGSLVAYTFGEKVRAMPTATLQDSEVLN